MQFKENPLGFSPKFNVEFPRQVMDFPFSVILNFENSSAHEVEVILSPNTSFAFLLLQE